MRLVSEVVSAIFLRAAAAKTHKNFELYATDAAQAEIAWVRRGIGQRASCAIGGWPVRFAACQIYQMTGASGTRGQLCGFFGDTLHGHEQDVVAERFE